MESPDVRSVKRGVRLDGQAAVEARRRNRQLNVLIAFLSWIIGGMLLFSVIEGWDPLETLLFNFSILTGIGYGHIVPGNPAGQVAASVWIVCGLCIFSAIAGQLLDVFMQLEIDTVSQAVTSNAQNALTLHEQRVVERRSALISGVLNVTVVYALAVLIFIFHYGERVVDAVYLASVTVFGMDNVCGVDGVHCSTAWKSSGGGKTPDMLLAVLCYIVIVPSLLNYAGSLSVFVGADTAPVLSRITKMNKDRFSRMDLDGDGKIKRSEFLRDRIIQGGLCPAEQVDIILKNFDTLDTKGTGVLNKEDIAK
eukprot:TRINITY_DN109702_c0_g1_i1.p1 TRINITY_DN109702_c0_g1~~TRINITY_DN109702_c0_g1_i1.p1  ORF type:complete len:309 (-),score=53.68 TRINITY_DN109702_c0_g1_i1:120-1046(-)